jgi:hypothetical protein
MNQTVLDECKGNNDNGCFRESPGHDCGCFKRIQQEELKQLIDLEIAIKLEEIDREEYQSVKDFSRGAKWQAKRMYSEEEVIKILLARNTELGIIEKTSEIIEFFEQFKKN